jgi:hypothetical protein
MAVILAASSFALASCGVGSQVGSSVAPTANGPLNSGVNALVSDNAVTDGDFLVDQDSSSVLGQLNHLTTIGSTVDPINGDQNPYGLDIAKVTSGKFKAGDLAVCNFNDKANVQGNGTTVVALHPQPGSQPRRVAQMKPLLGCNALALAPDDTIWAAAFGANDNPVIAPTGQLIDTVSNGPWAGPWGQTFSPAAGPFGVAAFYAANANDGSIVRINITKQGAFTFDKIATGFPINHGVPGSILAPSGLQYDTMHDRLWIVDGKNNMLVAFCHVSSIPAHGIVVHGKSFSGPFKKNARLVFSGPPLNGPISSALLFDDHIILGNTLDPNGKNLLIEITPAGHVLNVKNVDNGAGAALFGMVAVGTNIQDMKLYFNDDNDNTVKVLTK